MTIILYTIESACGNPALASPFYKKVKNIFEVSHRTLVHIDQLIQLVHESMLIRRGSRGGAKGAAAPPFVFLLIIIHIIHCYTHYFNLQAGVKIVIITILKIITFITKRMHSCKLIANTRMAMAKKINK